MLRIRMSRMGRKNFPTYRLIVSERTKDTFGDLSQIVGNYNPHTKEVSLQKEKILHWISKGAQPTDTVHNLLVSQGVIQAKKKSVTSITKARAKKIAEKTEPKK